MKKILLALLLPIAALAQTAVQKVGGGNNTISNGSIVIGNNTTITTTGNGSISGNIVPTSVPWSVLTSIPSPTLSVTGDGTAAFTLLAGGGATGAFTLATVNSNVGTFAGITVNGKGLVTAAANLTITTTAPLTGGGTLGNLTIAMPAATTSVNGYLTSTDWTTFNSKQAAGNYITALTGDGTAAGPGSSVFTLATVATGATTGSSTAIPVVTFNNKGLVTGITTAAVVAPAGTLTGTTLASNVVSSSLTSVGTIASGTWNGTVLAGQYGGSGVANTGTTFTRAGNVTFAGAFAFIGRVTAATDVTFPLTGTLATLAGNEALTNKSYNGMTLTSTTGTFTLAALKTLTVSNTLTFTGTDSSSVNFGAGGTVLYSGGSYVSSITGTANQISASASTGAVTLSIPSTFIAPGSIQATTNLTVSGTLLALGTAAASTQLTFNSIDSGTAGGASLHVRNNGSGIISIGNQSNVIGGAYSAVPMLYFTGTSLRLYSGAASADAMTLSSTAGATINATADIHGLAIVNSVQSPTLELWSGSANASARNWALLTNVTAFGDFAIYQSTAQGGNPANAGASKFYISPTGVVSIPSATASTSTSTGALVLSGSGAGLGVAGAGYFGGAVTTVAPSGNNFFISNRVSNAVLGGVKFQTAATDDWYVGHDVTTGNSDFGIYSYGLSVNVFKAVRSTGNITLGLSTSTTTVAGNLTVSGTGLSTDAGGFSVRGSNGATSFPSATSAVGFHVGGATPTVTWVESTQAADAKIFDVTTVSALWTLRAINDAYNSATTLMTVGRTGITTFASTVSGTSTTAAAVLAKSLGLTENLITGGFTGHTGAMILGSGGFSTSSWNASIYQDPTAGAVLTGTAQYGLLSQTRFTSGSTVSGTAVYAQVFTAAASYTQTSSYDFYAANPSKGAASAITTAYGLYVEGMTSGGTNYSIYTNAGLVRFGDNVSTTGSITTGTPAGGAGAAAVKFGVVRTGVALAASTTTGLQIDYAGTLYTLAVLSTNP